MVWVDGLEFVGFGRAAREFYDFSFGLSWDFKRRCRISS